MTTRLFQSFEQAQSYVRSLPSALIPAVRIAPRGLEFVVECRAGLELPAPAYSANGQTSSGIYGQASRLKNAELDQKSIFNPRLASLQRNNARPVMSKFGARPNYAGQISPYFTPGARTPRKLINPTDLADPQVPNNVQISRAVNGPSTPKVTDQTKRNGPPSDGRYSRSTCPVCGGDGGSGGQCYKCDGTGWA